MILTSDDNNKTIVGLTITGGLEMNGCHDVHIIDCDISGGYCNVRMTDCSNCTVEKSRLKQPKGRPDSDGNGPHNVLLDNCTDCEVNDNEIERTRKSEMGVGLYKCSGCLVDSNHIFGESVRESADAITVDYLSRGCVVINNKIDLNDKNGNPMGNSAIVVASGKNHTIGKGTGYIIGSVQDFPVAFTSYYDVEGNPVDDDSDAAVPVGPIFCSGFDREIIYIGPKARVIFGTRKTKPKPPPKPTPKPKPKPKPLPRPHKPKTLHR